MMKKFLNYLLILALVPALVLTSCKKDEDDDPDKKGTFEDLKEYMVDENLDLPALLSGWVIAPKLTTATPPGIVDSAAGYTIPDYHVFDIRRAADFNAGHIKNSINVPLADVVTTAASYANKPILVVCYSGQTAGRVVMALRLSGYSNAKVMKFGFSYWSSDEYVVDGETRSFDKWSPKVSDTAVGHGNWNTDVSPDLPIYDYPTWESNSTDGGAILAQRVDDMLANSDWGVSSYAVLEAATDYNIYNFWSPEHYALFGHYTGAYQIKPISIEGDLIKSFPNNDEFEIYCYTGQTSSYTTAWLHVLGYQAKSIYYGVNSLSHTALEDYVDPEGNSLGGVWHHSLDYDYAVTPK